MNYYQRFLGDYGRDTRGLSLLQHGAYSLLLDSYYATERPLPAELVPLYRICSAITPEEQHAVQTIADLFFPIGSDGLRHNKRADAEIAKALPRIEAARKNGQRGGQRGTQQEPNGLGAGSPDQPQQGTQREPNGVTALHLHQHHSSSPQTKTEKGKNKVALIALPDWVRPEKWLAWMQVRPSRARTKAAQESALVKLAGFRAEGFDPAAILDESISNGWQGIFRPKDVKPKASNRAGLDAFLRRGNHAS